ncbi:hypothetical protein PISMIDRAFT_681268, partial [Pisolithus microcarpus 441]
MPPPTPSPRHYSTGSSTFFITSLRDLGMSSHLFPSSSLIIYVQWTVSCNRLSSTCS